MELKHSLWIAPSGGKAAYAHAINGDIKLVELDMSGDEVAGSRKLVNFSDSWDSPGKMQWENICREFPLSSEKEIRFRLYLTNMPGKTVQTNEFKLPNPAFK